MIAVEHIAREGAVQQWLVDEWQRCLAQDSVSLRRWQIVEGGDCMWQPSGVQLRGVESEWLAFAWHACGSSALKELKNFIIEVTVSGEANAAGISFGSYKDFLTSLEPCSPKRRLQLEVDTAAGTWTFRVDGRLMNRCWWDAAVNGSDDIVDGVFTLKARKARSVLFEDFLMHTFTSSCRLSVIMTCYRFQQRLRVCLRNWCHQSVPSSEYEVLVVNPESPDGTHELLAATARSFPHVRVRELALAADVAKNKGIMINRAIKQSRGEWILLTDADCLFPPDCLRSILQHVGNRNKLFFGQRRYLAASQTDGLLSGRLDGLNDFAELARAADSRSPENAPWGYTQIMHRALLQRIAYPEHVNSFAYSDDLFVKECRRRRVHFEQLSGLFCLHLHHPFSWHGTDNYL